MRSMVLILLCAIASMSFTVMQRQVTFIIESLPNTTPEEDTMFICGNFNGWNVHDIRYMLRPQLDGTYSATVVSDSGTLEYKFSRGNWLKVETNEKNEYVPNRKFIFGSGNVVHVKIANWQDLGGVKHFNYMILFLFAVAFYGLFLIFLVYRIQKPNLIKLHTFLALNGIIMLTLFGAVVHSQLNFIGQSHVAMAGYILFFCWGPTLTLFLHSMRSQKLYPHPLVHYLPAMLVALLTILRLANFRPITFLSNEINPNMSLGNSILMTIGIGLNTIYYLKIFTIIQIKLINKEKLSREISLVNSLYLISCASMAVLIINYTLLIANVSWTILMDYELPLVIASGIIILEFYYFWKFPELLRDKVIQYPVVNADDLIDRLDNLMLKGKPFKNPELNIAELSDMLDTKPHILSKVINERFNKNYRDFINEYRVNEFIEISISEEYKNYTFLALAHEVGFNSKSTFNLAFKKITKLSPRDYLKQKHNIVRY